MNNIFVIFILSITIKICLSYMFQPLLNNWFPIPCNNTICDFNCKLKEALKGACNDMRFRNALSRDVSICQCHYHDRVEK
uniref:Uncharacterized protein n=1 Tax=Strongyloides stercoralis TaxID=6248 RepID=A0A0K0DTR9_STRER